MRKPISRLLARHPAPALAGILLTFAGQLHAQETDDPAPATDVPTLERVLAVLPDEEALDLYTFMNPVAVEPNRFEEMYDPPPSPEEIAMQHGGLINYGINLGLQKSWQGIKKVTGMRAEIQSAVARPPPLSEEQIRRAAAVCANGNGTCLDGN